jgi:hypothetical protein
MILELGQAFPTRETEISERANLINQKLKPVLRKLKLEFHTFIIHVFPAEAGIVQNNSAFLLDPGLRRGDDEHQNAKVL